MNKTLKYIAASILPVITIGCASAKYIDQNGQNSIVNVGQINTQDWIYAADQLTESLMLSGTIQSVAGKPKVLMIGRIKNNTATHIDTDSLMKKIRVSLNKSGRALTTTAVGLDGPEDASSKQSENFGPTLNLTNQRSLQKATLYLPTTVFREK